jgi:hypothetical protein
MTQISTFAPRESRFPNPGSAQDGPARGEGGLPRAAEAASGGRQAAASGNRIHGRKP